MTDWQTLAAPLLDRLSAYQADGLRVMASSSFQTQSMPLLHLLATHAPTVPVYFLDTGFHFPETLAFRDEVTDHLGLKTISVRSPIPMIAQKTSTGMLLWAENTERCCTINKTLPLEPILAANDVWITGVRRDQSSVRAKMKLESPGDNGVLRCHPMLEWTKRDIWRYVTEHELPRHPLELLGYESIGCAPCTAKPSLDGDRSGRWSGQQKVECGLHTQLGPT